MQLRYFFLSIKLKAFRVTQNETPKVVTNSTYTNKLSQNFAEEVCTNSGVCGTIEDAANGMATMIRRDVYV